MRFSGFPQILHGGDDDEGEEDETFDPAPKRTKKEHGDAGKGQNGWHGKASAAAKHEEEEGEEDVEEEDGDEEEEAEFMDEEDEEHEPKPKKQRGRKPKEEEEDEGDDEGGVEEDEGEDDEPRPRKRTPKGSKDSKASVKVRKVRAHMTYCVDNLEKMLWKKFGCHAPAPFQNLAAAGRQGSRQWPMQRISFSIHHDRDLSVGWQVPKGQKEKGRGTKSKPAPKPRSSSASSSASVNKLKQILQASGIR